MHWKNRSTKSKVWIVAGSLLIAFLVALIVVNFTMGDKKVTREIPRFYPTSDPQFQRTMGVLLGPAIVDGNRFETLLNGDQIFPAMLQAIRGAQKTINFETYIYWSESVGQDFADALAERARAGVKVHVLIDWVGSSKMEDSQLALMEKAGVEIRKYRPLHWYNLVRFNNRTHRKLLVVDGKTGFTGGVGIAGLWTGNAQDPDHWRDSHYKVEGPVVAQMQAVLVDNWLKTTGKVLYGLDYFPPLKAVGSGASQLFSSSPHGGSDSMALMYLLAITAAEHSIQLSSSYFVPDELTRQAMIDAAKRGVKIQIITPGEHMDAETVRRASRGSWGQLLEAGIEMHEYQPTMYHCKVMIVDGLWVSVGSTNFDDRSFRLNDEANLNIYDADFARKQVKIFQDDLKRSRRFTKAQWENRPWKDKLIEHAAALLGPLL